MNSEVTRNLIEATIDFEEKKAKLEKDPERARMFAHRAERLRALLKELYPETDDSDLSSLWDEIVARLQGIVVAELPTGQKLYQGGVLTERNRRY
jgi:hypothetical protein